jgi:hypothetical protein
MCCPSYDNMHILYYFSVVKASNGNVGSLFSTGNSKFVGVSHMTIFLAVP